MSNRLWAGLCIVALSLTLSLAYGQGKLKSGPQVGEDVPGPFHPLNVTGDAAGKKKCLYCEYGVNPVAVVFARELTPQVKALIKHIDQATAKNQKDEMCSFAVFCTDNEGLTDQLKAFAGKEKIEKMVLAIDNPTGPKAYNISKDAEVTVFYYTGLAVKANHAFRKGELTDAAVTRVAADVSKILESK